MLQAAVGNEFFEVILSNFKKEMLLETDPSSSLGINLLVLLTSFAISSFFSAVKTVFYSIDKDSIPPDKENLRHLVSKVEPILKDRVYFATLVSLGKTIANTCFALVTLFIIKDQWPQLLLIEHLLITIVISVVVLTLLAYTLPRSLGLCYYQSLIASFFPLYGLFNIVLYILAKPISLFYSFLLRVLKYDEKYAFLSDDEKSRLTDNTDSEEALDKEEKAMIRNIFELGETAVSEIMVPRIDIKALDITTDFTTAITTIHEAGHSRIPVYKENIDSIVGILYAKDILGWISHNPEGALENKWDLESLLKDPLFVPSNKKIDDLMSDLRTHHIHMAIVVDEYGGTAGVVTMEDILEEIVGEIQDEYDTEESPVKQISENTYLVKPHIELDDLAEILNITIDHEDEEYNTLSGLFYHEYGDVPDEKTEFEYNGLRLKILKMDNQRIEKLALTILHDKETDSEIKKESS